MLNKHGWVVWICRARKFRAFADALRFRAFAHIFGKCRAFCTHFFGAFVRLHITSAEPADEPDDDDAGESPSE